MKRVLTTAAAMTVAAHAAGAGGLDRSGQSILAIFETGGYAELSFGAVQPSVSGTADPIFGGFPSGTMSENYFSVGAAYKTELRNGLDIALIIDQPFGADVNYPAGTGYFAAGSTASLTSTALTGVLKYRMANNISIFGGLRYQTLEARVSVPFVGQYTAAGAPDDALGYLVGVGFEKPEIALRVALTYASAITHELDTAETLLGFLTFDSLTEIKTPQSVNLEFQTGIAKDTLLFGSVRWVDWTEFVIDPPNYPLSDPIVSYDSDTVSYALGLGRRFNEAWSAAVTLGYEAPTGGFASNLGPTDGYKSIGIGATYARDNLKITGGVRYVDIGDAQTTLGFGVSASDFTDNHAIGAGVKVAWSF